MIAYCRSEGEIRDGLRSHVGGEAARRACGLGGRKDELQATLVVRDMIDVNFSA